MASYDAYYAGQRRRQDEHVYHADDRHSRSRSPPPRGLDSPSPTLMLRNLSNSTVERDVGTFPLLFSKVHRALENERARYTEVRLVRDKKNGRLNAFVDFCSINDARQFMKDCRVGLVNDAQSFQGEIEIRKSVIRMTYSNPKERRDDDRVGSFRTPFTVKCDEPSPTIMLRGIPPSMDSRDIRDALDDNRINYVDVRVIRDKNTGVTKGFGFVDFATIHDAKRWMEFQKGILRVRRHELRLTYSAPRQAEELPYGSGPPVPPLMGRPGPLSEVSTGDWICSRCSSHNFRRREQCYKCQLPRSQVQSLTNSVDGVDLVGTTPCNTLVLRCLDALTTEEDICKVFEDTADVKVRQCHVMRDEVTHTSRCFAFAELPTVADAYKVMDIVSKEYKLFEIGGKAVTVSYAKNTFNTIMATLKTEGSYNAQLNSSRNLALDLAHAAMAAQNSNITPDAIAMNAVAASALLSQGPTSGPAVAHAAIQQKQTEQHLISAIAKSMRAAQDHSQSNSYGTSVARIVAAGQTLPPPSLPFHAATAAMTVFPYPDTTKYIYDESTRFYYDPVTGLLYEPNSKYFYDRVSQRYYYWDQTRSTYFPVPQPGSTETASKPETEGTNSDQNAATKNNTEGNSEGGERVRLSKGKSAQQIAKEMEKWAKRMNAQKKNPIAVAPRNETSSAETSRTADTGYALFEAAVSAPPTSETRPGSERNSSLVAQYGGAEDSDDSGPNDLLINRQKELSDADLEAEGKVADEEAKLLDWAKLACLLCSRGFKDAATLQKHRAFSALHIENLNKLRAKHGLQPLPTQKTESPAGAAGANSGNLSISSLIQIGADAANDHAKSVAARQGAPQYRDRARERREKYGMPSPPRRKYDRSPTHTVPLPTAEPVPMLGVAPAFAPPQPTGPSVGSRLMEKMGWQAGQGLGRENQGRTQIIEAEFREAGVGLGIKPLKRGPPSDNYKDNEYLNSCLRGVLTNGGLRTFLCFLTRHLLGCVFSNSPFYSHQLDELISLPPNMATLSPALSAEFIVQRATHVHINSFGIEKLAKESSDQQYQVLFNQKVHTGYWALCAAVNRAVEEGFDLLDPNTYQHVTEAQLKRIFRSVGNVEIPLFAERLRLLRESGKTLVRDFGGSFKNVVQMCERSAFKLLDVLCEHFPSFKDTAIYEGQQVSFLKRAQLLVGELWLCFNGQGVGAFDDIDKITAFADYRVPQVLFYYGAVSYSDKLLDVIRTGELIPNGSQLEVEIRGATIHAVQLIVQKVKDLLAEAGHLKTPCNAILADNYLWTFRREHVAEIDAVIPMHKTRCLFY
ncbi:g-patch domain protein [Opisthorchis viverrini]|uniref:G-patch domain protein n=1 Tax=Opisthorchis viverrini TaxID=6198 RepID=A0A1S8WI62_OPIVI|nr:g-patch domain protein [Opisthorchis viverrini]